MFKNKLLYLMMPLLIASGFWLGYISKSNTTVANSSIRDKTDEARNNQYIPECVFGLCPIYETLDIDGDTLPESIVFSPTSMTKGAGQILIIDEGEIVFRSQEHPQISYEANKAQNGINISFTKEFASDGIKPRIKTIEKYLYTDGKYELKETVDERFQD